MRLTPERSRLARGVLYGLCATAVMGLLMVVVAAAGRGNQVLRPFPGTIMARMLGDGHGAGFGLLAALCYFAYGALAGLAFAYFCRPMTMAKGIGWGLFLWFVMEITFVPWLGFADFGLARRHGGLYALYELLLHLVYGVTLGRLTARDERQHHAAFDDLGRLEPSTVLR
jgi:hypothetical protein